MQRRFSKQGWLNVYNQKGQMLMWNKIILEFQKNPRDVRTCPTRGHGVWFYVWVEAGNLYVSRSKACTPSSKIKGKRWLNPSECEPMLELYKRRCRGESVSQEATALTRNQVYWYGIFYEMKNLI